MKYVRGCAYVVLSMVAFAAQANDVKAVEKVDLDRYQGKWHEIASIPQFFQRECVRDTVAEYTKLESGEIKVDNTCTREDSARKKAEGRARLYD
ncbi:MAG: lipocalin family protein, partial [Casimicrobium sp.]